MNVNTDELVQAVKKIVAISIAGAAAALVATWRKVRAENEPAGDGTVIFPDTPRERPPAGAPDAAPGTSSGPAGSGPAGAEEPAAPAVSADSSRAELYEAAQRLEIPGRSKMTKAQLLAAIRAVD